MTIRPVVDLLKGLIQLDIIPREPEFERVNESFRYQSKPKQTSPNKTLKFGKKMKIEPSLKSKIKAERNKLNDF